MRNFKFLWIALAFVFTTDSYAQTPAYTYAVKTLETKITPQNRLAPYFVTHIYPKQKFIRKEVMDYSDRGLGKAFFYTYSKSTKGPFLIQVYYANGQLKSEMYQNPLDPNLQGYENQYYPDGQLKSTVFRMMGIYAGLKTELYENGKLAGWGQYLGELENGQQKGYWMYYYDNGQLKSKGSYQNNFSSKSRLSWSKKTGEWKYYDENGELVKTENF